MQTLGTDYRENVESFARAMRVEESFDLIRRTLKAGEDELTLFYIDGFVKDVVMQRIFQFFIGLTGLPRGQDSARTFAREGVPYVEVDVAEDRDNLSLMLLSGAAVMFGSTFGANAIVIDARTYPARETQEPDSDRVMQGAKDGFVETLIFNTALIRRRLRDPRLTMHYMNLGGASKTDVVLCYMEGVADEKYVERLKEKIASLRPASLTLGAQSVIECLVPKRWYNPFPKVRTTERPDAAASQLTEGSVLLLVDTSPQALILPTSFFDFLQETDDFYFSPLTGSYLRLVRLFVFTISLYLTPLWYLLLQHPDVVPPALSHIIPQSPGQLPILFQLLLVEFAIDGLKLASMNTPDMLSNSLSVIGGLILGDFAVSVGWLAPDVILYMAIVTIGSFSQQNHELSYAAKFMRIILLVLTAIFDIWGFIGGIVVLFVLMCTNRTLGGRRGYLYPLIPFSGKALLRLFFRLKKNDVEHVTSSEPTAVRKKGD